MHKLLETARILIVGTLYSTRILYRYKQNHIVLTSEAITPFRLVCYTVDPDSIYWEGVSSKCCPVFFLPLVTKTAKFF